MRVLISSVSSFYISREGVLLAREKGARWAVGIALWEESGFLGDVENLSPSMTDAEWRSYEEKYSLPDEVPRHDSHLLAVFDEIGSTRLSGWDEGRINEVELPNDIEYSIHSYCAEWVEERHRRWDAEQGEHLDSWRYFNKGSVYEGPP